MFDRPHVERLPWDGRELEPNEDMYATADETSQAVLALYQRATDHADETIQILTLDAVGRVPWWPDGADEVTLHWILSVCADPA